MPEYPAQIGRYRILSRLGAGGMGEVYLAEDTSLGRRVALKRLPADIAADSDRARRFAQEARLAATVNHPNIAQIFEIGEADGVIFIAMEYVEGEALSVVVKRGALPAENVIAIAQQMFDALDEAHASQIIHRDLKPANIVMTPRGRVKILDFGLATRTASATADIAATRVDTDPGLILGTLHYMSPEQALGRDVDARSDIFSAGVVLYELLTGRLPFSAMSVTETLDRIVHAQPDSISRLNYAAPPELERIVKKTLEKEPARRYQSARDVLVDLANLKRDSDSGVRREHPPAKTKRAAKTIQSLAVLPLTSTSPDVDNDYLADGITESLINALSQLPKLKVMARSTVFRYKGRDVDPQTVGRELGVRAVLLGRLQASTERVVVRAELVDAQDGAHLWGGQFQRPLDDVLVLQEDLAQQIAEQLRVKLTRTERKRLQKRHTENPRAYEAYMRGLFQMAKRTSDGFSKAIECFEAAIAEDPSYALAHAGLADSFTLVGAAAYVESPANALSRARQAAERAIGIDDELAEAHSTLGFVRYRIDWDWPAAEASLQRACALNPGLSSAHHRYALLLSTLGRHAEALDEIAKAEALDPLSSIIGTAHGRILHFARRYEEAVERFRLTLENDPTFAQAHFDLGMAYAELGRVDDAVKEMEPLLEVPPRRSVMLAVLGNIYARQGNEAAARAILQELRDRGADGRTTIMALGYVYVGLGEIERALDSFERAADQRAGLVVFLKVEPMVDPLRGHPRFARLLQRLNLA